MRAKGCAPVSVFASIARAVIDSTLGDTGCCGCEAVAGFVVGVVVVVVVGVAVFSSPTHAHSRNERVKESSPLERRSIYRPCGGITCSQVCDRRLLRLDRNPPQTHSHIHTSVEPSVSVNFWSITSQSETVEQIFKLLDTIVDRAKLSGRTSENVAFAHSLITRLLDETILYFDDTDDGDDRKPSALFVARLHDARYAVRLLSC